jgi:succinate dehydrogenase / fumarate reductase membrane anchor subunit
MIRDKNSTEWKASAKHGGGEWVAERISSVVLIPLGLWGVYAATEIVGKGYEGALAFLIDPLNAGLMALLILTSVWHMHMGLRVVIEDYIGKPGAKGLFMGLNTLLCVIAAGASVFSIVKIALTALGGAQA